MMESSFTTGRPHPHPRLYALPSSHRFGRTRDGRRQVAWCTDSIISREMVSVASVTHPRYSRVGRKTLRRKLGMNCISDARTWRLERLGKSLATPVFREFLGPFLLCVAVYYWLFAGRFLHLNIVMGG